MSKTPNTLDKMLEAYEAPKKETNASIIPEKLENEKIETNKTDTKEEPKAPIEEEDEYKIFVGGLPGSTTKGKK